MPNFNIAVDIAGKNSASPELAALAASLAQTSSASDQTTVAQNKLDLQMVRVSNSALRLAEAQTNLAANTDPEKQASLEGKVLAAQVALDRETGSATALTDEMGALGASEEATSSFGDNMAQTLTGIQSGMMIAQQAVGMLKGAFDQTGGAALSYGQTIEQLSDASGQNAQATSTMAVVLNDFGIKADGLDKVIKTFTKEGLQFNLSTLQDLAAQYQSIQDPVERDAFSFKNFGRSALDMNEVLSASPAKFQELAAAAQYSGEVITDQQVAALEADRQKLNELDTQLNGMKVQLGIFVDQGILRAVEGLKALWGIENSLVIEAEVYTGRMTWQQAATLEAKVAAGDLTATLVAQSPILQNAVNDSDRIAAAHQVAASAAISDSTGTSAYTRSLTDMAAAQGQVAATAQAAAAQQAASALATQAQEKAAGAAATATEGMATALSHMDKASIANSALGELSKQLSDGKISAEDYTTAADQIGLKFGLMTPQSIKAGQDIATLGTLLSQHKIDPETYAGAIDKISQAGQTGDINLRTILGPSFVQIGMTMDDTIKGHLSPANTALADATPEQAMNANLTTLINNGISPANKAMDNLGSSINSLPKITNLQVITTFITRHVDEGAVQ